MNYRDIWEKTLKNLEQNMSSVSFNTWFRNIEFVDVKDNKVRLLIPHPLYKNHLETNYKDIILNTYNSLIDNKIDDINFLLRENIENEEKIETLDVDDTSEGDFQFESNLIKHYTFDNFVVGESNTFAQAAALAVAENPGYIYNPLFIYGNSGLGKTHLMHAIGNYIEDVQHKKVLYVTCDQFMEDFTGLSRREKDNNIDYINYFKNKYRNIDVLIVDDIQFLGNASKTQQEFFHTFNNLYNNNKQIIISSDRSPEDLKLLEDRLRTRFYWGLKVNIDPPDLNLKINIIKKKIKGERINRDIPEDVINYMASHSGNDVRQLEGSLTTLIAYSTIMGYQDITLDVCKEALKDQIKKNVVDANDHNSIRKIQKVVADVYKISFEDIKSKKKSNNIAIPRQVAMYLCRKLTNESLPRIGIEFGGKNHTTVMYSCNKIEQEINSNKALKDSINEIEKLLQ